MTARGYISLKEKLASALCQMLCDDGTGKLVPVIPYSDAKLMSADMVLSLFHFDHWPIRKVDGGPDRHFNLVPRFIKAHREKTAKKDAPEIAKVRELSAAHIEFQRKVLARPCGEKRQRTNTIRSRGFPKRRKPLRGPRAFIAN